MTTLDWIYFKQLIEQKSLAPQYTETTAYYYVKAFEAGVLLAECILNKNLQLEDIKDFETNFKDNSNIALANDVVITDGDGTKSTQFDTDGAQIVRMKAAKKGWSFWAVPLEIITSTLLGSLYSKTSNGADISWINCKIYDENGTEITTAGSNNENLLTCAKTVIDFEPTFDYEIVGGILRVNAAVTQDVRLWIIGAPDIPAEYGGSKEFASGINLKFLAPDNSFEIDGRVTKYLSYDSNTHQGKMRIILKHPAGVQINAQLVVHIYRL